MNFLNRLFAPFVGGPGAVGLLVLRLIVGTALALHGWGKIRSPFDWMGPNAPVPGIFQFLAAFSEFFGGLALVVGLLTPLAAFGIFCTMLVATQKVASGGAPFVAQGGGGPSFELSLAYLAVALLLMLAGPGALSLDALLFGKKRGGRVLASQS